MTIHKGQCHCGEVTFEFVASPEVTVYRCSCSICRLDDFLHLIIPDADFRLLTGEDHLHTYTFNSHIAQHHFCSTCGIKSFYVPRSNPDGVSINFRCVDESTFDSVSVQEFDGANWEANASTLAHLSRTR